MEKCGQAESSLFMCPDAASNLYLCLMKSNLQRRLGKQNTVPYTFVCRFARFTGRFFLILIPIGRVKVKNQIKFCAKTFKKRLNFNNIYVFSGVFQNAVRRRFIKYRVKSRPSFSYGA